MDDTRMDASEQKPQGQPPARQEKQPRGAAYEVYTLLHDLVYILACVTIVFVFAIRLVGVDGDSMYPTLHDRDYLGLLSNVFYQEVEQGDIVVMTVPYFQTEPIVKRVVATEGQQVDIDFTAGLVYVDGVLLDETYIYEPTYLSYDEMGQGLTYPATVPEGCIFVMGDNRNHSADSRYAPVGMVDERDVLGKVLCVLFPGKNANSDYPDCRERDFSRIGLVS